MYRKPILFLAMLGLLLQLNGEEVSRKPDVQEKYYAALRLFGQNQPEAALAAYREIIALDPTFWPAYNGIVAASLQLKQLDQAQGYFEALSAAQPNNPSIYYGLGDVYSTKRDYPQALAYYKR